MRTTINSALTVAATGYADAENYILIQKLEVTVTKYIEKIIENEKI